MMKKSARFCSMLIGLLLGAGSAAHGQVLFSDGFDASPDWQSAESFAPAANAAWPNTWADRPGGPVQPPPQNWTSYRAAVPKRDNKVKTFVLSAEAARNPGGKGMTYNLESIGYGTWVGGGIDTYLGGTGYKEMFVRFYLKFDPATFHWGTVTPNFGKQKVARISRLKVVPSTTINAQLWDTPANGSYQMPTLFPDLMDNPAYDTPPSSYGVHLNYSYRYDPTYYVSDGNNDVNVWNLPWPSDGGWHCYEYRVKMNSAPGVADGEWEIWIDGGTTADHHFVKKAIPWVQAGGSVNPGWNWVTVLDNATIQPDPAYANSVMKLFLDDVVIATSYSGPPPAPTNMSAQGVTDTSIKLSFQGGSNGTTFQTDGYRVYYGTSPGSLTTVLNLPPGATETTIGGLSPQIRYYFAVTAYNRGAADVSDNESVRATASAVTVDTMAPALTLAPVPSSTKNKVLSLSGTVSDTGGLASVTVKVGALAAASATVDGDGNWSYTVSSLSEGGNSITVTATDYSGNATSVSAAILLDTVAPTLTMAPVVTPTILTSQQISGTVSDHGGVASVLVQVGGGEKKAAVLSGNAWSYEVTGLQPGQATQVGVTAIDTVGNESTISVATMASIGVLQAGDLSGDSTVGVDDAQTAMQMAVGIKKPDLGQLQRGDLAPIIQGVPRPDGVIDTGDAVVILGIITGVVKF